MNVADELIAAFDTDNPTEREAKQFFIELVEVVNKVGRDFNESVSKALKERNVGQDKQ